jgi:hypothetical protein
MNWTCKLLAVALAAVVFLSIGLPLHFHAQSTSGPQLGPKGSKPSLESVGVCHLHPWSESSGSGEPYNDADAYDVYSAIIPTVAPNPETNMWFIRIDTLGIRHGSSLSDQAREEWKKARGADTALDDYFKVNAKHWLLQGNFTLPKPYRLVSRDEIRAMFPRTFRGGRFGELWIELSAVGFNANKTTAVVYMVNVCTTEDGCAEGQSFVLQKQNGKWKVVTWLPCWIS